MSIGNLLEMSSRQTSVGIILVGRLGVPGAAPEDHLNKQQANNKHKASKQQPTTITLKTRLHPRGRRTAWRGPGRGSDKSGRVLFVSICH